MTVGANDLLATAKDPFVAVSPADAARLGIHAGHDVTVRSEDGRLVLPALIDDGLAEGIVFVPANSTTAPGMSLASEDGGVTRVVLTPAAADEPDDDTDDQAGAESAAGDEAVVGVAS